MRQARIVGERQAEVFDAPDPRPKDNWALVRVHVAPMCTEYKGWLSGGRHEHLGHEAVGEVVEVAQPGRVAVGDRVVVQPQTPCGACRLCVAGDYIHCQQPVDLAQFTGSPYGRATMAQYLLKPDWLLSPIPEGVGYEAASLAICALGPSFGAFDLMGVTAFDTVLVVGLGPVGLGAVVNAGYRGSRVIAVESNPWRQAKARSLGASLVLDPTDNDLLAKIREETDGAGVDASLDCAGAAAAQRLVVDATRRKGRVAFVAASYGETVFRVTPDLVEKGLTLHGAWHYNLNAYPRLMQVIQRAPNAADLITHRFALEDIQTAFETLAGQQTGKVILLP
ncbi:MAG: zinc-binding dehydrogenase [Armatimonadetes bacterium]|nr:zinc-binding dehydrogenase [Armatimonadota bacterium]